MAAKKYYAVKRGRVSGVFNTWEECKKQVDGYAGAIYKSFPTKEAAETYINGMGQPNNAQQTVSNVSAKQYDIYVDGSFQRAKGLYSWAFAVYEGDTLLFKNSGVGDNDEAVAIHNVAGELAAAMRAVKWAEEQNVKPVTIHHDYMGIAAWATGEWKAKNKFTQAYVSFIAPRISWVKFNKVKGHAGVAGNELVDKLAGEAIKDC